MMGKQDTQGVLFCYKVNLDQRVRQDHPLRRVQETIDFSFVRQEVAGRYGYNGNVSVDPEVILKMMFLLFFDNVASERELMRIIPERLDYMWFLGYGLDDVIPDHSVLSKARRRWGAEVFESLFVRTVYHCVQAGVVDGTKVHVDASLIQADASNDSVVQANEELIAALRRTYEQEEAKLDEGSDDGDDRGGGPTLVKDEADEATPVRPARPYQAVNKGLMSRTDPDAAAVRLGKGESRLRYKNHRAVDDAHGVITATGTTAGDVVEGQKMMDLLDQHEAHTSAKVDTAVGDSKYGTTENFRACAEREIDSHMADLAATQKGTGRREGIFTEDAFIYDSETDTYRCPAGQTLRRRRHKKKRRAYEYTAGQKTCEACALRAECTRSKWGRSIKRHEDHEAIAAARAKSHSAAAKRDRRRRKHVMEGSFADAANQHGFKRSRWRGLVKQQIQGFLIAAIQNIRIMLRHARRRAMAPADALAAPVFASAFSLLRVSPTPLGLIPLLSH